MERRIICGDIKAGLVRRIVTYPAMEKSTMVGLSPSTKARSIRCLSTIAQLASARDLRKARIAGCTGSAVNEF